MRVCPDMRSAMQFIAKCSWPVVESTRRAQDWTPGARNCACMGRAGHNQETMGQEIRQARAQASLRRTPFSRVSATGRRHRNGNGSACAASMRSFKENSRSGALQLPPGAPRSSRRDHWARQKVRSPSPLGTAACQQQPKCRSESKQPTSSEQSPVSPRSPCSRQLI
jgi:hypothetical protein